jgi:hypothetical protein
MPAPMFPEIRLRAAGPMPPIVAFVPRILIPSEKIELLMGRYP